MFGSTILEVAIGMILIYLVLSLVMTSVQEALHALMKTRARTLEQTLLELLQGDETLRSHFYQHPLIYALHRGQAPAAGGGGGGEAIPTVPAGDLPSYIPRETFSAALIDLRRRAETAKKKLPEKLQQAFEAMEEVAGQRADALRTEIERWYDAAMDRASGRFKRKSQLILFVLSLSVAVLLNFNSFSLAQYLAVSPQQRALVTKMAEETLAQRARAPQPAPAGNEATTAPTDSEEATGETGAAAPPDAAGENAAAAGPDAPPAGETAGADSAAGAGENEAATAETAERRSRSAHPPLIPPGQVNQLTDELREIGLPIGWSASSVEWLKRGFPDDRIVLFRGRCSWSALFAWILLIAGYLVTAFAIMLGAPFWFDLLNKFMVIRGTVKPREKSPDEASEDRQPRPTGSSTGATQS